MTEPRRLVDIDELERIHSVAHPSAHLFGEGLRAQAIGECSWCNLLDEVRLYRSGGAPIVAKGQPPCALPESHKWIRPCPSCGL